MCYEVANPADCSQGLQQKAGLNRDPETRKEERGHYWTPLPPSQQESRHLPLHRKVPRFVKNTDCSLLTGEIINGGALYQQDQKSPGCHEPHGQLVHIQPTVGGGEDQRLWWMAPVELIMETPSPWPKVSYDVDVLTVQMGRYSSTLRGTMFQHQKLKESEQHQVCN